MNVGHAWVHDHPINFVLSKIVGGDWTSSVRCHQTVFGKTLEKRAGTGTTDARFFGLYAGIPAMV